jgi:hypothetical protein
MIAKLKEEEKENRAVLFDIILQNEKKKQEEQIIDLIADALVYLVFLAIFTSMILLQVGVGDVPPPSYG